MEIQSLSIVVPTHGCICECKTCISRTHATDVVYEKSLKSPFEDHYYVGEYIKRLQFACENGFNSLTLTGAPGEPLQNIPFLSKLSEWNKDLSKPFRRIELQTTGVLLTDTNLKLLRNLGVNTISLSNFNIFDDNDNFDVIGVPDKFRFDVKELCEKIKAYGFNLRMCLNLTKAYSKTEVNETLPIFESIFDKLIELGVDQLTLRKLYTSDKTSPINDYILNNRLDDYTFSRFNSYMKGYGKPLELLPFGSRKYSYRGIAMVIDENCLCIHENSGINHLILRENCKLYSKWDDKASLIF